jgi:2-polyprenyl-3-methyl-5-hydroxy-6-metoxy-1,4-benzoquinol methylase
MRQFSTSEIKTIEYYNENANAFIDRTFSIDASSSYARFLPFVKKGGCILDAGCGSGRDTINFSKLGFDVSAFDASKILASKASKLTGKLVACSTFEEMDYFQQFDGVWCCASLLHVPADDLPGVLVKIERALRIGGAFFLSFKTELKRYDQRHYTIMSSIELQELLEKISLLEIQYLWESKDLKINGEHDEWVNAVAIKR